LHTAKSIIVLARRTVNLQANELIRERGGSKLSAHKRAISPSAENGKDTPPLGVSPRNEKEKTCEKISTSFIKERLFRVKVVNASARMAADTGRI